MTFLGGTVLLLIAFIGASAPQKLTPTEQSLFANLLAEEFSAVCVKTDAVHEKIGAAAKRRDWKSRPIEIHEPSTIAAWDGRIAHRSWNSASKGKSVDFVVVAEGRGGTGRRCALRTDALDFAALRDAMANQGYDMVEERRFADTMRDAVFCIPKLLKRKQMHTVHVFSRSTPEWPGLSGTSFLLSRDSGLSRTVCPETLYLGSTGSAETPEIEEWLGQKQELPTPPHE